VSAPYELLQIIVISERPRNGVVYNLGGVCHVCLPGSSFFAYPVYLQGIRVLFVWSSGQSHISTSMGNNSRCIKHRATKFPCSRGFRIWQIEWCITAIFVTWSKLTTRI